MSQSKERRAAANGEPPPHKAAVVAMWLFSAEYSQCWLSPMAFWATVAACDQQTCRDLVARIAAAPPEDAANRVAL